MTVKTGNNREALSPQCKDHDYKVSSEIFVCGSSFNIELGSLIAIRYMKILSYCTMFTGMGCLRSALDKHVILFSVYHVEYCKI